MTRTVPEVSVIMPVRNGADTIAESLKSLMQQTLRALEVIVVDDGSTDATPEILRQHAMQDERIRVVRREPAGIVAALCVGVEVSQASLIARLDADDLAYPLRLERQRDQFLQHPDLVLLGTAVDVINWHGQVTGQMEYPASHKSLTREMAKRNPLVHSTVMMRKAAYYEVGGYRSALQMAEDYDLWYRLSERGRIANLQDRLGAYRKGPQTYSNTSRLRQTFVFSAARRCARLRAAGHADPLADVLTPLSLDGPCPDALQADQAFFRQLREVTGDTVAATDWQECVQLLELARGRDRQERRLVQDAVLGFWRRHSHDTLGAHRWAALLQCIQLDPWRFPGVARRAWKRSAA